MAVDNVKISRLVAMMEKGWRYFRERHEFGH